MARTSSGTIYRRPNTENWWLDYYDANGKRVRRSAGTADESLAQRRLAGAMAAEGRSYKRSDPSLPTAYEREQQVHDLSLTDQVARLRSDVQALKQLLAYYELLWPRRRDSLSAPPRPRDDDRKLAHIRKILAHCIAEIDRAG